MYSPREKKREKFSCLGYHFVHVTDFLTVSWPLQHSRLSSFLLFFCFSFHFPHNTPAIWMTGLQGSSESLFLISCDMGFLIKTTESFFLYHSFVIIFSSNPKPHNLSCLVVLIYYYMIYCFIYLIGCFDFQVFIIQSVLVFHNQQQSTFLWPFFRILDKYYL